MYAEARVRGLTGARPQNSHARFGASFGGGRRLGGKGHPKGEEMPKRAVEERRSKNDEDRERRLYEGSEAEGLLQPPRTGQFTWYVSGFSFLTPRLLCIFKKKLKNQNRNKRQNLRIKAGEQFLMVMKM